MTEQPLSLLQHWMKTVVTERGGLPEKLAAASRRHGLSAGDVVAETRGLSAEERLGIYTRGYVMRLLECMRADFPALRDFVGDAVFDAFARAYLIGRPPSSSSLYDLSADFPRFLEETKPEDGSLGGELRAMLDLPAELARLERARAEVARARGTENDAARAEPFSPLAVFSEELTLHATPCLRLLGLKFPLADFLKRSDRGERPEPPRPRPSFVAVGRADYRPNLEEIAHWQFAFLKACGRPVSLYAAARLAARESAKETGQVLAEVAVWLPVAVELGYLRQVPNP
jgi:hypothetical protein